MENGIRFTITSGIEGLQSIKDSWRTVTAKMTQRRFYHLYSWYNAYIRSLEDQPDSVHFFVGYRESSPVAVLPLKHSVRRVCGIRMGVLELPTHSHMSLSDFVFNRDDGNRDLLGAFYQFMRNQKQIHWDIMVLPLLLEDSSAMFCLTASKQPKRLLKEWDHCYYLKCRDYDGMFKTFSRNFRKNLRTARNNLNKMDGVEFTSSRKFPTLLESFNAFLDVEASGWKGTKGTGTAIRQSPPVDRFYGRLLQEFSSINACEVNLLKAAGECLAGQFCLVVDDTIYILKIGFNESYRRAAPGNMLLEAALRKYQDDPHVSYVNLISSADWICNWHPSSLAVYRACLFNRSMAGLWSRTLLGTRWAMGRLRRRILKRNPE